MKKDVEWPDERGDKQEWITIMTFTYPQDAYIVKGALESEGIDTFLMDELTIQGKNFLSNAVGGVKLQVPIEQFQIATELLESNGYPGDTVNANESKVVEISRGKDQDISICPFCNSENIGKRKRPTLLTLLLILFLYIPLPFFKRNFFCYDCGKDWIYK